MSRREKTIDELASEYRMDQSPDPEDRIAVVEESESDSYVSFHPTLASGLEYMNTNENLDRIGDSCLVVELDTGAEYNFDKVWHYDKRTAMAATEKPQLGG